MSVGAFNYFAQVRPFGKVLEIEANVVRFRQVVEVAWVEFEQVHGAHGSDGRHSENEEVEGCDERNDSPQDLSVDTSDVI